MKKNNKNALIVLFINNTIMNLQGPLVRHITAEILHHIKSLCIIYMGNWLVGDHFFIASLKTFKDSFCFTSSGTSSHTLGSRYFQFHYTDLTRGILKQVI